MNILIACEFSGRVRDAFRRRGHNAFSCDLRKSELPSPFHYQCDVRELLKPGCWDLLIGFPYCTFNALAGIRWFYHPEDSALPKEQRRRHPDYPDRMKEFEEGIEFFKLLWDAPVPRICLENSKPHGLAMDLLGKPNQLLQPWMFGEPYSKTAALWLKNLPNLKTTHTRRDYDEIFHEAHEVSPYAGREKERSRTRICIAEAMASQWNLLGEKNERTNQSLPS